MRRKKPAGLFKTGHHDENHPEIKAALMRFGPEPYDTTKVGKGFPDFVWPFQGLTVLIEVKTEGGEFTPAQVRFREEWRGGPLFVLRDADDVPGMVKILEGLVGTRRKVVG